MTEKDTDDKMLDALFDAAREDAAATPSASLMARVLEDASALQPSAEPGAVQGRRDGFWRALLRNLGGWPSVGGLATAAVAGLWIGIAGSTSQIGSTLGAQVLSGGQDAVLSEFDNSYAFLLD